MSLRTSLVAVLAFALPAGAAEPQEAKMHTDRHGDSLPEGAVARFGTTRLFDPEAKRLAFSPDGKLLATSGDRGARVWDVETGRCIPFAHLPTSGHAALRFAPDGAHVLGTEKEVRIIDPKTGKVRVVFQKEGIEATNVVPSPDGKSLAVTWKEKGLFLYDLQDPERKERQIDDKGASRVIFSRNGAVCAWLNAESDIVLWDVRQGKRLDTYSNEQLDAEIVTLALSPDGSRLAVMLDRGKMHVFDTTTHKDLDGFTPPKVECDLLRFSADGKELIGLQHLPSVLIYWSAATGKELRREGKIDQSAARLRVLSPDGKRLAWCDEAGQIRVWDLASSKYISNIEPLPELHDAFWIAPDLFSVRGKEGPVFFCSPKDGRLVRRHQIPLKGTPNESFALSPDGKSVAVGDGKSIGVYDFATKEELRRFGKFAALRELSFSADGNSLAAVDYGRAVTAWNVATGKLSRECAPREAYHAALSPDTRTIAFAEGLNSVCLAELSTGKVRRKIALPGPIPDNINLRISRDGRVLGVFRHYSLLVHSLRDDRTVWQLVPIRNDVVTGLGVGDLSPDGRWLAHMDWSTDDVVILLRDLENPEDGEPKALRGHQLPITSVAFSPDGKYLVSTSEDHTALVWDMREFATAPKRRRPDPSGVEAHWTALGDKDAEKADRATMVLEKIPDVTIPLLKARLRLAAAPEADRLRRLVAELDSAEFAVRDKANRELERLGDLAEPALQEALKGNPSAEAAKRIGQLLDKLQEPISDPEQLRYIRAVEVLERIGTSEAAELLKALAKGTPAARVTKEAKASLERLTQANEGKRE
jgi:WD40 repeat protein